MVCNNILNDLHFLIIVITPVNVLNIRRIYSVLTAYHFCLKFVCILFTVELEKLQRVQTLTSVCFSILVCTFAYAFLLKSWCMIFFFFF